jgi:hypothetical protein
MSVRNPNVQYAGAILGGDDHAKFDAAFARLSKLRGRHFSNMAAASFEL